MKAWPLVKLQDISSPIERAEIPVPGKIYRQIGVKWWGEGAYEREPLDGGSTRYSKFFQVVPGDLVINKIWTRHGSVCIIPDELSGCYVSNEFPAFTLDIERVEKDWLHWLTKTRWLWEECAKRSQGTSGKNRIRPDEFLRIAIPLPPLEDQRRILVQLSAFSHRHAEVLRLRQESEAELQALCRSILFSTTSSQRTRMSDVVSLRQPDTKVERHNSYSFAGVYCFGKGVFKGQTKSGMDFAYDRLTKIRAGEFTYPKLMAWEGALGVVPEECDGLFLSPEYPVFTIHTDKVLPEVLDVYYRTPSIWPIIAGASTGTNVRRRRLHPSAFLNLSMPVPPMTTQIRIRTVRKAFEAVSAIRRDSVAEVNSLLSAVVNRAFNVG